MLDLPDDNPLKRKAEGETVESRMVGGLFSLTEDDHERDVESDEDSESDASDWLDDEEVNLDDKLIAEAREVELDNWDRFKVYDVKEREKAVEEGYKFLGTRVG